MVCNQDEIVSGFRGHVVTFTAFDHAADLEIQCSRIRSSDGPNGPFRFTLRLGIIPRAG